jgi:hypothetical protein
MALADEQARAGVLQRPSLIAAVPGCLSKAALVAGSISASPPARWRAAGERHGLDAGLDAVILVEAAARRWPAEVALILLKALRAS